MLEITPALSAGQLEETVAAIAAVQHLDGAIPEFPGGVTNPWNHIEAAMALDVAGRHDDAVRAYEWSRRTQRRDGAWSAGYLGSETVDHTLDANFCAYIAFGVWHHFLATRDRVFLAEMWPCVEGAIDFTLGLQRPDGAISWARDAEGRRWQGALLTSCSCILMSMRSATAIAAELGHERPAWDTATLSLLAAIRAGDQIFESKRRFSMDWYYPVLADALDGESARTRLLERWDEFVVSGLGARCVVDRPWITSGETAELVIALHVAGMETEAHLLLDWVQHLRAEDGAYWIGATFPDGTVWPQQKPTWGSGSVVLAADVMAGGITAACF
jgi:hypothetical protein